MCNPTLALAIGAQVAGTVVQNQASKRAQRARNEAIANNNATRMGLEDEARLAIDTSKNMFGQDQFDAGNQAINMRNQRSREGSIPKNCATFIKILLDFNTHPCYTIYIQ